MLSWGLTLDIETRRQKQKALMVRMVERKVRQRAQQLYDERGQEEGRALNDWVQAESEVIENTALGQVYKKVKIASTNASSPDAANENGPATSSCETSA